MQFQYHCRGSFEDPVWFDNYADFSCGEGSSTEETYQSVVLPVTADNTLVINSLSMLLVKPEESVMQLTITGCT